MIIVSNVLNYEERNITACLQMYIGLSRMKTYGFLMIELAEHCKVGEASLADLEERKRLSEHLPMEVGKTTIAQSSGHTFFSMREVTLTQIPIHSNRYQQNTRLYTSRVHPRPPNSAMQISFWAKFSAVGMIRCNSIGNKYHELSNSALLIPPNFEVTTSPLSHSKNIQENWQIFETIGRGIKT